MAKKDTTMTVRSSIDPARLLEEQLAQASPDLLRELLDRFINTLISAEADAVCGAEYGEVTPERVNRRNGYRHRDFDTRAGTLGVAIPKLCQGCLASTGGMRRRTPSDRLRGESMRWVRVAELGRPAYPKPESRSQASDCGHAFQLTKLGAHPGPVAPWESASCCSGWRSQVQPVPGPRMLRRPCPSCTLVPVTPITN
jgi:hypothetical protein